MPKILQSTTMANRHGILLLALAIALPCTAATLKLTTLYSFTNLGDGGSPESGLVLSSSGALFGTTSSGESGWGSVFELTQAGGTWTETTLYTFTGGTDGANPVADLVVDANNVLYGTTYGGGANGYGTVFQLAQSGGVWTETVLHSFAGGSDGAYPAAGLLLSSKGILYGTTYGGGSSGLGTVFQLVPGGGGWTETVIHTFQGTLLDAPGGAKPLANLAIGSSGALFGTTSQGGSVTNSNGTFSNWGTVFQLTPGAGGVWTEKVLYTFTGGSDGGSPESAVIIGKKGILYGSTFWGGTPANCPVGGYPQGCGTVYQLVAPTAGGTPWNETVLYTFTGRNFDGAHPYGKMALNASSVLFGTTFSGGANLAVCFPGSYAGCGTIFMIKPLGGSWQKFNLIAFPGSPGGGTPNGLILATGGAMYGTTVLGGNAGGYGTVFRMAP